MGLIAEWRRWRKQSMYLEIEVYKSSNTNNREKIDQPTNKQPESQGLIGLGYRGYNMC